MKHEIALKRCSPAHFISGLPGLTRFHPLLPNKVVLHDSGTNRVILHDRNSGFGCSSSTTLFPGRECRATGSCRRCGLAFGFGEEGIEDRALQPGREVERDAQPGQR